MGTPTTPEINSNPIQSDHNIKFDAQYVKADPGETVLTIVEGINNNNIKKMAPKQIITDFKLINPSIDPHNLRPNHYYYFPLYTNG
ncbi:hypothetical protein J2Z83_000777 [Virgibacillus natechei]|uniref:LysM domain-containing protein n=1 Tax=Virgibacillus natechei TaxID=1216297 RepID=A0ABS4ICP1_9BACI|nr:hypothetical protein [Virgibacillus natechei]